MPIINRMGVQIYYEDILPSFPITHTVVLIHGLGCSAEVWTLQQPMLLAQRCRVIMIDLRGHGRSNKPKGSYSIALFSDDLAYVLQALNAAPSVIIGHSLGGMIAYDFAIRYPQFVHSLVIINSFSSAKLTSIRAFLLYFHRIATIGIFGIHAWGRILVKQLFPEPAGKVFHAQFLELYRWNERRPYLAALQALVRCHLSPHLQEIRCPVLLISADHDYLPVAVKKRDLELLKNAQLAVVTDSRHFTLWDQADALNRLIKDFISTRT